MKTLKKVSTVEMVQNMINESKEVKSSLGGTKEFRQVCGFVNSHKWYQDDEITGMVERTPEQIAEMVESEFSTDVINEAKSVYTN